MKVGLKEKLIANLLMVIAFTSLSALILITIFIFAQGLPVMLRHGFNDFLFNSRWAPTKGSFGIFPMIVGSIFVTLGALVIGVPLGVATALFLAEVAPGRVKRWVRPLVQLLAGIPSVVYGFMGVVIIVPFIRDYIGGPGLSLLAASFILGIMILPTIVSISQDAIEAVPRSYKEGSLALGATQWQTIRGVILPAAKSGIIAAVILGMGRAIGETMAVIMIIGNSVRIPHSILDPARTLTSNIALEMAYSVGEHREALFATAVVLFVFIMVLNTLATLTVRKEIRK